VSAGRRPVCAIVGPPGSGKTTVGQLVAESLGVEAGEAQAVVSVVVFRRGKWKTRKV